MGRIFENIVLCNSHFLSSYNGHGISGRKSMEKEFVKDASDMFGRVTFSAGRDNNIAWRPCKLEKLQV
jgi:hypothetical protein